MNTGTDNNWQMATEHYNNIAQLMAEINKMAEIAKNNPTQYDEWFNALRILSVNLSTMFKEKDYNETIKQEKKIEQLLKIDKTYNFDLDLSNNPKYRYEVHNGLMEFYRWLLRKAYNNKILIPIQYRNPEDLMSGV